MTNPPRCFVAFQFSLPPLPPIARSSQSHNPLASLFTPSATKKISRRQMTSKASNKATCTRSADSDDAFYKLEHTNWQRGVDAYSAGFGPLTSQSVPTLLEKGAFGDGLSCSAAIQDAQHILDVATGQGPVIDAAISKAKSMKIDAKFTALDFSSNFLQLAKRNLEASHPDTAIDWIEGDAQAMPFDNEAFTSVCCNFGILHLSDPDLFLSESYRILKPGGRLAFSAWSAPPATEGFGLILSTVNDVGNPHVELPAGPPFFRFSDANEIQRSMEAVGFKDIDVTTVETMEWHNVGSADDLYEILLEGTARTRELLRAQTPEETYAIQKELQKKYLEISEGESRPLRMPCVVSSGRKPFH